MKKSLRLPFATTPRQHHGYLPPRPKTSGKKHHKIRVIHRALLCLCFLLFFPTVSFSQNDNATSHVLRVGVIELAPLYMKTPDGRWEGYSVELWQDVAARLGIPFEFQELGNLEQLLEALEQRRIDVIPSLPVRERLEAVMDFSQSYLKSGLAIAVPAEGVEYAWRRIFETILSTHSLKAIGFLMALSIIAGVIVWRFEKGRNSEMFGGGHVKGIGHGIWWAMVTMSTVGYGDLAPKTLGGRIVALVWMFFLIIFIAVFTASITTSLTISELKGKVRGFGDLYSVRTGSIPGSEGFNFLTRQGVAVVSCDSVRAGMEALTSGRIDAFVLNEQLLSHMAKRDFPGRVQVLPGTYDEYFVSIALQQNSTLRKPINKALLSLMNTQQWTEISNRYMQ
jgi:ABC-type amino acid transport substrate-binding protein